MSKYILDPQYKFYVGHAVKIICALLPTRRAMRFDQEGAIEIFKIADMLYVENMVREMTAKRENLKGDIKNDGSKNI